MATYRLSIETPDITISIFGNTLYELSMDVRQFIYNNKFRASEINISDVFDEAENIVGRISYNGCIWDNRGYEMFDEYPEDLRTHIIKFRKDMGDFKSDNPYLRIIEKVNG